MVKVQQRAPSNRRLPVYQSRCYNIPEDLCLQQYRCETLKHRNQHFVLKQDLSPKELYGRNAWLLLNVKECEKHGHPSPIKD